METFGWYGTGAILFGYGAASHGAMDPTSIEFQLLNISGAVGVGLVCLKRRAWQPLALEVCWATMGISALARIALGQPAAPATAEPPPKT